MPRKARIARTKQPLPTHIVGQIPCQKQADTYGIEPNLWEFTGIRPGGQLAEKTTFPNFYVTMYTEFYQ